MQVTEATDFRTHPRTLECLTACRYQRQHILLSYFKTLSVGSVQALNPDLPLSSPLLI